MNESSVRVLMLGEKVMAPSRLLQRCDCDCWFAGSADAGIELFEKHNFQVVLSTGAV
jgi:hypothetical protein